MDIPNEAYQAARVALWGRPAGDATLVAQMAVEAAAPHIRAPLLERIVELEAKLAESERISGVLREQRNAAEDELRGRA